MRHLIIGTAALGWLLSSTAAIASAWASGGGKILKHERNPWFLENTETVSYCIDIDEQAFGVSRADATAVVADAIDRWQAAFELMEDDYYNEGELEPYSQVRVGTQYFRIEDCSDSTMLRFQLGTLTPSQRKIFEDPRDYIGVAARMDYDLKTLVGRGFVYIAPMSGELAPNVEDLRADTWAIAENALFKVALWHELGHVFGIGHGEARLSLMDERLPEFLVKPDVIAFVLKEPDALLAIMDPKTIIVSLPTGELWGCGEERPWVSKSVFGISHEDECQGVVVSEKSIKLFTAATPGADYQLVGTSELWSTSRSSTAAISVFLPREQTVFTKLPADAASSYRTLYGELANESLKIDGAFWGIGATTNVPLRITVDSLSGARVTAIHDGRFVDGALDIDQPGPAADTASDNPQGQDTTSLSELFSKPTARPTKTR